ncbi:MAG: hypothetical protein NC432_03870 [Roseburia sp.]|nr:hypothetical protein [Roseburia sp.]MCM1098483.1 hypothetical protein [Ruminococcus flavefaciens]
MWEKAGWIALPEGKGQNLNGKFAYYRTTFHLSEPGKCVAGISANSRYRLWVNEEPVLSGPCRGDKWYTYYDTVDLSPNLRQGKNVLAVQVLLFDEESVVDGADERAALYSVVSHFREHLLAVDAAVTDGRGEILADLTTGVGQWKVWLEDSFSLVKGSDKNEFMGAMSEQIDCNRTDLDWKKSDFAEEGWRAAEVRVPAAHDGFRQAVGLMDKLHLYPRPIPLLKEEEPTVLREMGSAFFSGGTCRVEPHERRQFLFTSEALCNGYLRFGFSGGKNCRVAIHCFEKFYQEEKQVKRDDFIQGKMYGNPQTDSLILSGRELVYEPFWYRTIRFLRMDVETADEAAEIELPAIRKAGYPLQAVNQVSSSAAWVKGLWDICLRTLENCMMDGYMDCPFWEQMQYPMDTRLQALFTYASGGDIELVKKAMWEFHCSRHPCGLIQGKAPSAFPQMISTFSLYYIFMINEYVDHTNDVEEIRKYLGDVDDILTYYDSHREEKYGLVGQIGYWPFVDWQQAWASHGGAPNALERGPSTIINLMYAYALEQAACICESVGRAGMAEEYRRRKKTITETVQRVCYNEARCLYREGPEFEEYSQHAQSWAVLCGMCGKEEAAKVMRAAFGEGAVSGRGEIIPCSFSTSYELFRACEAAGEYGLTYRSLRRWIELLDEHCTTCPEVPEYTSRSECHAWSSLPMYEMVCAIAGVHTDRDGTVRIEPHFKEIEALPNLSGRVEIRQGMLEFSYRRREKEIAYQVTLPQNASGIAVICQDRVIPLHEGKNIWKE